MGREEPMEGWFHHGADLEWNGRELVRYRSFTGDEDFSETTQSIIEFTYNADGIRTSKTVDGVEHRYYLSGSLILGETWTENGVEHTVVYIYDESSTPVGIQYRNSAYTAYKFDSFFFEKNLQGDVVAIYNEFGEQLGAYFYDAWGNHTVYEFTTNTALENSILNTYNPFRYRSYFYDVETELYYLQTRYYNPVWGRFLNMDDIDAITATPADLTDKNLYAYCDNNPVTRMDAGGEFWHILAGAVVGAIVGAVVAGVSSYIENGSVDWLDVGVSAAAGAIGGILATTSVGVAGSIVGNAVISMATNATSQAIENNGFSNFNVDDMLIDGVVGGISGAIGGAGKGSAHLNKLGKQTLKRPFKTMAHKGVKAGFKDIGKAFTYYGKNTSQYYKNFIRGIPKDTLNSIGGDFFSSDFMKAQYHQLFAR